MFLKEMQLPWRQCLPLRIEAKICENIAADIERLRELKNKDDVVSAIEVNELACRILRQLLTVAKPKQNLQELLHSSERVQVASGFIRRNINRRVTVAELARACSISPPGADYGTASDSGAGNRVGDDS